MRLLYVGECSRVKGLVYLVEAMARLPEAEARLDIAGGHSQEPAYYQYLLQLVDKYRLHDRVRFHGFVGREELERLYMQSDILMVPSLLEGYGMVVAEAYCYGLPVIASDAGALGEIIRHGENGLLVQPADPTALVYAVHQFIENPTLRENMAGANIRRASTLRTWADFAATLDTELTPLLHQMI